jgi:hypothetical protein
MAVPLETIRVSLQCDTSVQGDKEVGPLHQREMANPTSIASHEDAPITGSVTFLDPG